MVKASKTIVLSLKIKVSPKYRKSGSGFDFSSILGRFMERFKPPGRFLREKTGSRTISKIRVDFHGIWGFQPEGGNRTS